jgi:hypothetical protein
MNSPAATAAFPAPRYPLTGDRGDAPGRDPLKNDMALVDPDRY